MKKIHFLAIAAFAVATALTSHGALVAHYTFDTDGTASTGSDATLGNAASITGTSQVGAGALSLSGTPAPDTSGNDGAVGGDMFSWSTDTRTVAFWMKAAAGDVGDANAAMIALGSGSGAGNRFDIRLDGDALRLEVQSGGVTTSSDVADGTWHHLAVVVPADGATVADVEYYIDGSYVGTFAGSSTAIATGSGPLRMGDGYQDAGRDFKGSLDDVRLYDHALSDVEIAALAVAGPAGPGGPNVILIMCDDLGFGDIYNLHQHKRDNGAGTGGVAGDGIINGTEEPFIYTPGLDRMAAEGAKLTRHYTSAPVCAPARGSLIQGLDQGHANIRNNSFDKIISDNHTLGTVMKQAGYYTSAIGKWGVGGSSPPYDGHPNNRGFDYFYGVMEHLDGHYHYPTTAGKPVYEQTTGTTAGLDHAYSTDLWTAKAKQIIQDRHASNPETPFFIYLAYDAPHARLEVPTQAYPAGRGTGGGLSWPLNTNSGTNDSWIHPDYATLATSPQRHATMVRRVDDGVDDILQTLRDLGIDDNTLVVFTSDNGTHNESGSGGSIVHNPRNFDCYGEFEGIKRDTWEGGIRMPTFAWWPTMIGDNNQATPGLNSTRPSAFWDWMPTFAEVAGLTPPAWSSGVSLLPELTGSGTQQDKGYLYFEYSVGGSTPNYADFPNHGGETRGEMQVIFMDDADGTRYKGIRTGISSHTDDFQIYDVDTDFAEGTNLASTKPALQQKMKDKVLRVRIDGDYNRTYLSSENVPAVSVSAVVGLEYKAFSGAWDWVPETAYLAAVASGECSGLDLSVRPQDDNILLEFTGLISVPADGSYTFSMTSDSTVGGNTSGGMLWIHDAHVIDDDFNHDGTAQSGTLRLQAGLHPIRVLYRHSTGSHDLDLQYSGPGISMQPVPGTALLREIDAGPVPIANPDSAFTLGTNQVAIGVLANDVDDGQPVALSIQSVAPAHFGTAIVSGNNILYTADAGKYGVDQFIYTITDGQYTSEGDVTVDVLVPSHESVVLHTDFTGFSTAGTTISSFSWSSELGEEANATTSLTLTGSASGFKTVTPGTGGTGPAVGVSGNIETSGPWGTSFTFTPSQSIDISSFDVSSYSISGGAAHQQGTHSVTWTLEISSAGVDFNGSDTHIEPGGSAPQAFSIDTTGTTLNAGTAYTFSLTVSSVETAGNNIAFDTLTLNHSPYPDTDGDMWYYQHFGNAEPTLIDWETDSNADGYSHYAAYALGGSPHWFDPGMIPYFTSVPSGFDYQYNRRLAMDPADYILESTFNLTNTVWNPVAGGTAAPHPSLADYEVVTVPVSMAGRTNEFYRLRIAY